MFEGFIEPCMHVGVGPRHIAGPSSAGPTLFAPVEGQEKKREEKEKRERRHGAESSCAANSANCSVSATSDSSGSI